MILDISVLTNTFNLSGPLGGMSPWGVPGMWLGPWAQTLDVRVLYLPRSLMELSTVAFRFVPNSTDRA